MVKAFNAAKSNEDSGLQDRSTTYLIVANKVSKRYTDTKNVHLLIQYIDVNIPILTIK